LNCRRITDYKLQTERSLNLNVTHIYTYGTVKLRCRIHENEKLCSCDNAPVCILHRLMKAFKKAEPCFRIVYSKLTQTYL